MAYVVWSPSAIRDVEQIAEYISRDSVDRAALFVTRLIEAAERLGRFPGSGRMIPELDDPNRREIIVSPYRIMYLVEIEDVWITAVVHGARDW